MSLISCPKCGKQVSDKAEACPHCGVDLTEPSAEYDDGFYQLIKDTFEKLELDYDENRRDGIFALTFSSKSAIGDMKLLVSISDNHLIIWGAYDAFNYIGPNSSGIYELIGRLNSNIICPPLSYSTEDGRITCKCAVLLNWKNITQDYFLLRLNGVTNRLSSSGDAIMLVANGIASPEQAAISVRDDI